MKLTTTLLLATICLPAAFAVDKTTPAKLFDGQLSMVESEIVPLAEAMPAGKYNFAPTAGEFKTVRNFGQQVKHVAAVIYMTAGAVKGETPGVDIGAGENGPDSATTKEQIVKFLKDAFAYAHTAMATLTEANMLELVKSPFGGPNVARADTASSAIWHTFDHYGQMVVYARMNSIVPPASR